MTNHTVTSSGAGSPSTKQGQLGNTTHFTAFRYLMLNSKKIRVSTRKRVYFQKFLQSLASVVAAAFMFLLVLALCCRSTCQFHGNSESHAQCHVRDRIRIFDISEHVKVANSADFAVPEGAVTQDASHSPIDDSYFLNVSSRHQRILTKHPTKKIAQIQFV